ncbi:MAG: DUF305 domain-containing protein [Nocardioidaceae bacterium]
MKRTLSFVALALAVALTVAGCGNGSKTSSGGTFNDADVTFTQSMIPHHRQAVEMATLARTNGSAPEVKTLAVKIEGAQGPEIDTMTQWLKDWGQKVPSDSMSGMGHSGSSMPGMMSDADMRKLDAATGPTFDRMFLTMMTSHHSGAIEMAKTEQKDGKNPDAVALAKKIEADQTAEIADMEKILGS